jgi:hypothetical protein
MKMHIAGCCNQVKPFNRTYAQHLNHWGTAEGVNPLGPLEIL